MKVFYPGSFDPITNGHKDLISRLTKMFERVVVGVGYNPLKTGWLPVEVRVEVIEQVALDEGWNNVEVVPFPGLAIDAAKEQEAHLLVKGLRGAPDLPTEMTQATLNRDLSSLETLFVPSDPKWANLSSSAVRELVIFGAPIASYVPPAAERVIRSLK